MRTFKLKKNTQSLENKLLKVRSLGLHKDFYYNWKVQLGLTPLNSTHHMTPLRWSNLFLVVLIVLLIDSFVFVFRVQIRTLKDFKDRAIWQDFFESKYKGIWGVSLDPSGAEFEIFKKKGQTALKRGPLQTL